MTEKTRKQIAVAKMAWIVAKMADPSDGDRDLFGFLGHTIGVSPGDTRSVALAKEFSDLFGSSPASSDPKNAAAAMRRVMDKLEEIGVVVSSSRPLNDAKGWQKTWKMTPGALFLLEKGQDPEGLVRRGVPKGAFAEGGAMFSPKAGVIEVPKPEASAGSELNLYVFTEMVDGEEARRNWRGGKDCEEALELIRADGHQPIFVESLKGGAPGYWCRDEAERGISQIGMPI